MCFNHDAATAVEDVKLQTSSLDLVCPSQVKASGREFQRNLPNESVDCVLIMFSHSQMAMGPPYDLPYSVELWDDEDRHVEELIALTGDYRVARAAFEEAVKRRPGRIITLRQKARLLADSRSSAPHASNND